MPERGKPNTNTGRRGWRASAGQSREQLAIEHAQETVDESLVLGRHVLLVPFAVLNQGHGVRSLDALGGAGIFAAPVERMGQREQEPCARAVGQLVVGQPRLERGQVFVGQLAAQAASPAERAAAQTAAAT